MRLGLFSHFRTAALPSDKHAGNKYKTCLAERKPAKVEMVNPDVAEAELSRFQMRLD